MKRTEGFTLIEAIVAMTLLAVVGVALTAMLPLITRNTQAATIDTSESQKAISIFEQIARDWSNPGAWSNGIVYMPDSSTLTVADYVQLEMATIGRSCTGTITAPSSERRRVTISCPPTDSLPERIIKAEFGDPNA